MRTRIYVPNDRHHVVLTDISETTTAIVEAVEDRDIKTITNGAGAHTSREEST